MNLVQPQDRALTTCTLAPPDPADAAPSETATQRVIRAYERIYDVDRPEVWISLRDRDDVLGDAARVDASIRAGRGLPLAGTVFAVKDNIDVAGMRTTAAVPRFPRLPERTAVSVQRLLDAGAILIGKTNLDQFATGLVGTRSPYGVVRNARYPDRVSGGSSSGSAVAVALGVVDFALGTDTAGSGRVPAAFNGIVGFKSTLGLVPTHGVVPACPSYDAVTVFARTLRDTVTVTALMTGPSGTDGHERSWPADVRLAAPRRPVVAIPGRGQLAPLSPAALAAFDEQVERLAAAGAVIHTIDITPMLDCGVLLYDGALVAERYAAFGHQIEHGGEGIDPVVHGIVVAAKAVTAVEVVRDQQRVLEFRLLAERALDRCDVLLLPTAPFHPTIAEIKADPVVLNSKLGIYTNFVNLLDMSAVSVPAADVDGGLFGVTVIARRFDDQVAIDVAAILTGEKVDAPYPNIGIPLAVFGAHMTGLPLNPQLESVGARKVADITTAPRYRMFALPGSPPKPGVVRVDHHGAAIPGELWLLSPAGLGTLLAGLPRPMTLGRIELADGREVVGFGCSSPAGSDITGFGGWRSYIDRAASAPDPTTQE